MTFITRGKYNFTDFRNEVISALTTYYGSQYVDTSGGKSIKVLASSNRLNADVVPCVTYKRYESLSVVAEGITFWNSHDSKQIINYPKLHLRNGESKNSDSRTNGRYKPSVRMFKNARDRIVGNNEPLAKQFPSYFIESLFYNLPDDKFLTSCQFTFTGCVSHLLNAFRSGNHSEFVTQSEQHLLFGDSTVQWSQDKAYDFICRLEKLWRE